MHSLNTINATLELQNDSLSMQSVKSLVESENQVSSLQARNIMNLFGEHRI